MTVLLWIVGILAIIVLWPYLLPLAVFLVFGGLFVLVGMLWPEPVGMLMIIATLAWWRESVRSTNKTT